MTNSKLSTQPSNQESTPLISLIPNVVTLSSFALR